MLEAIQFCCPNDSDTRGGGMQTYLLNDPQGTLGRARRRCGRCGHFDGDRDVLLFSRLDDLGDVSLKGIGNETNADTSW